GRPRSPRGPLDEGPERGGEVRRHRACESSIRMSGMCGISVLLDRAAAPDGVAALMRMHAPIRHRGPDGEGFLVVEPDGRAHRFTAPGAAPAAVRPRVGLAFRRLKILDLTEAAA